MSKTAVAKKAAGGNDLAVVENPPVHVVYSDVLKMIKAGDNPLLIGPSGCGKTTIAQQLASTLKVPFSYLGKVTADFQIKGYMDAQGRPVHTTFRKAYENGGLFLFDELDSSEPDAITSAHAALENGVLDAPDGLIKRHPKFFFMAAANTWGHGATLDYVGRNRLDGATLDRFATKFVDYDEDLESRLIHEKYDGGQDSWVKTVQTARAAVRLLGMRHIVSLRASFRGAALLEAGMDRKQVAESRLFRGLPEEDKIKLVEKMKTSLGNLKNELGNALSTHGDVKDGLQEVTETLEAFAKLMESKDEISDLSARATAVIKKLGKFENTVTRAENAIDAAEQFKDRVAAAQRDALAILKRAPK